MITTLVLTLPDFTQSFSVETNACDTGTGAVLMQHGHPTALLGRALGVNNRRLTLYEKEVLAVMIVVDCSRPYLERGKFTIPTDDKSLRTLGEQHPGSNL